MRNRAVLPLSFYILSLSSFSYLFTEFSFLSLTSSSSSSSSSTLNSLSSSSSITFLLCLKPITSYTPLHTIVHQFWSQASANNMMESMESYVPPGFRFHPTDEELVGYYLRKKVASQKIDLDVIRDIDLYRIEPWDLQERCRIGYEEQNEWYFFSHKDKKYPTGTRTNRATMAGFWKATGRDKAVYDKSKLIGMRKTLVFYKGRAPNGQKSDWIMHEYRLESEENGPPQEEGWVVCRAFKKRTNGQNKSNEGWDSSYFYDEPSGVSSVVDPIEYMSRQQPQGGFLSQNLLCKQELEADNLSFMQSDQYLQLPQLESPSLPLLKRPISSISLTSENNEELVLEDHQQQQQQQQDRGSSKATNTNTNTKKVTTDWRALDKFVASQLSQEEGDSSFGGHSSSDMALLLLQEW